MPECGGGRPRDATATATQGALLREPAASFSSACPTECLSAPSRASAVPCPPPQVEFQIVDTDRGQQASNVTGPEGAPLDRAAGERAAPGSDEF